MTHPLSEKDAEISELRSSLAAAQREAAEAKEKGSERALLLTLEVDAWRDKYKAVVRDREQWIKPAIEALTAKIQGKDVAEYLAYRFPATEGHIPLYEFLHRLKQAADFYQLPQKQQGGAS